MGLAGLIIAVTAGAARAQLSAEPGANPPGPARPPATAGQNPTQPPEVIAPPTGGAGMSGGTAGTLGNAHSGVLRPPAGVDPGMRVQPPGAQRFPTPVIPPPGTRGNQPNLVPK